MGITVSGGAAPYPTEPCCATLKYANVLCNKAYTRHIEILKQHAKEHTRDAVIFDRVGMCALFAGITFAVLALHLFVASSLTLMVYSYIKSSIQYEKARKAAFSSSMCKMVYLSKRQMED